jgi:hypothetical protein
MQIWSPKPRPHVQAIPPVEPRRSGWAWAFGAKRENEARARGHCQGRASECRPQSTDLILRAARMRGISKDDPDPSFVCASGASFEAASRRLRTRWLGVAVGRQIRCKALKSLISWKDNDARNGPGTAVLQAFSARKARFGGKKRAHSLAHVRAFHGTERGSRVPIPSSASSWSCAPSAPRSRPRSRR